MVSIHQLKNTFDGCPAAVLGGGPSLPKDLQRVPDDALLLAVNHHAFGHCDPHMLVYMDDPREFPNLKKVTDSFAGLQITTQPGLGDVDMSRVAYWLGPGSGIFATWLACWLGCDPVLLCGMDLYQGETKYCHADEGHKPIFDYALDEHLRRWRAGLRLCSGIERVFVLSGPLEDVFPRYQN